MRLSRQASWRARSRIVVAAAMGLVFGLVVRSCVQPAQRSRAGSPVEIPSRTAGPGPRELQGGVPTGFARSPEGARAAASAYVTTGQLMLDLAPTEAADAVREMAARASANRQADDLITRLSALRERLAKGSGPVQYWQAVLGTRVDAIERSRARVAVWSVGVLSRRDVAPPQAGWTTSDFELVWERGDWKVWSEDIATGPTPMLSEGAPPATDDEFATAVRGFEAWRPAS
jgi:hypothetical protein